MIASCVQPRQPPARVLRPGPKRSRRCSSSRTESSTGPRETERSRRGGKGMTRLGSPAPNPGIDIRHHTPRPAPRDATAKVTEPGRKADGHRFARISPAFSGFPWIRFTSTVRRTRQRPPGSERTTAGASVCKHAPDPTRHLLAEIACGADERPPTRVGRGRSRSCPRPSILPAPERPSVVLGGFLWKWSSGRVAKWSSAKACVWHLTTRPLGHSATSPSSA